MTPAQEYDAIANTIQAYLDGGRSGNMQHMAVVRDFLIPAQ